MQISKANLIFATIVLVLSVLLYNTYKDKQIKEKIIRQNALSYADSTTNLDESWSRKIALVSDLNAKKDSILSSKDETILNQQKLIVDLKSISDSGVGIVIHDTTKIGEYYSFKNSTGFYKYDISVWFDDVPRYNFNLVFNPFELSVYLARSSEGIWSGYAKVGDSVKKYVSISKLNVFVDRDEYTRMEKEHTRIDLGIGGNILLAPQVYLGIGGKVLIDNTNEFGYIYYLGVGYHAFSYTRFFNLKR